MAGRVRGESINLKSLNWSGEPSAMATSRVLPSSIFLGDSAHFQYNGASKLDGKPAIRYDYAVPQIASGYQIQAELGGGHRRLPRIFLGRSRYTGSHPVGSFR